MKLSYYPGCTLKTSARNFEEATLASLSALDVELEELTEWNCCGTVFSLATDDLIHHLAPIRNLVRAKEQNTNHLATGCAMCYNTLKRANMRVQHDQDALDKLNNLMYPEGAKYEGDVRISHILEVIRDRVGLDAVARHVKRPLGGLKVASYYGCLLVRPKEVGFDDPENPSAMDDLVAALGGDPIDFPFKTECCGAYHTVHEIPLVVARAHQILEGACENGAEVVAVSCPLCAFNLDHRQERVKEKYPGFQTIPVMYFSQLMAIAFDLDQNVLRFGLHYVDPQPLLAEKGLL